MSSFNSICKKIHEINPNFEVTEREFAKGQYCIVLNGEDDKWENILKAGQYAVDKKYLGVINDIKLKGFKDEPKLPKVHDDKYDGMTPDVLIIGGGITGCAIAREMAKYNAKTMLVEKGYDVALMTTSRNDGNVHVGIDLHKGTQKHTYLMRGNKYFEQLSKELDFKFERGGHHIYLEENWEKKLVPILELKAKKLGIPGVYYVDRDEMIAKYEPNFPSWAIGAVRMETGGIVSPYKMTIALAENAAENGVEFAFNTAVLGMTVEGDKVTSVKTNRGTIYPKVVINASGTYADIIADMAKDRTFTIHPRKGTDIILDKKCGEYVKTTATKAPFKRYIDEYIFKKKDGSHSKGGGATQTVDGNILIGPDAEEIPEREDFATSRSSLDAVFKKQQLNIEKITYGDIITYFAGCRAATYEEDFVVRKGINTKNIIEAAGIQSPGIGCAPAIAEDVCKWTSEILGLGKNKHFNPIRKTYPHLAELPDEERDRLVKENPAYGEIVCRCEQISRGEIEDCLHSALPIFTVDAIKRRCRPGMGRCQGGFCSPLVVKIIAKELGVDECEVRKAGEDSVILYHNTKGGIDND